MLCTTFYGLALVEWGKGMTKNVFAETLPNLND